MRNFVFFGKQKLAYAYQNGVQLGWLINPDEQKTYIYRPNQSPETIEGFDQKLSGDGVLNGFEFDLGVLK
ncbi:MAG TPA: hypothetical protein DCS93_40660 [Microscillaceae bacterium]|nr:hypothetical protein [Microscillaceae bacterium]